MEKWKFKSERSPAEISLKLQSALSPTDGFVFNVVSDANDTATFTVRKRILYAWYCRFQNWTVVSGKILKENGETTSDVKISFKQHFLIKLIILTQVTFILPLIITFVVGVENRLSVFIISLVLIVLGIVMWFRIQKKFEKDIQIYKKLISQILN